MSERYCLTCKHWQRLSERFLGVCAKLQNEPEKHRYRGQFEGCALYRFGGEQVRGRGGCTRQTARVDR